MLQHKKIEHFHKIALTGLVLFYIFLITTTPVLYLPRVCPNYQKKASKAYRKVKENISCCNIVAAKLLK